jgi:hypothetical protein
MIGPSNVGRADNCFRRSRFVGRSDVARQAESIDSDHRRSSRRTFRDENRLRAKTNFVRAFNAIPSVQISTRKYFAWRVGQISRTVPPIPPQ